MGIKFCYFCAADTSFTQVERKLLCSQCNHTELEGKRSVNSVNKSAQKKSKELASSMRASDQEQHTIKQNKKRLPHKPDFCTACESTDLYYENGWYCDKCGRSESAAEQYIKSIRKQTKVPQADKNTNYSILDSSIALLIITTLIISTFPFSLIFLVCIVGLDGTIQIVKELTVQIFKSTILLIITALIIFLFILFLMIIFQK